MVKSMAHHKKSQKMSSKKSPREGCKRQTTKRYTERNSPPYPGTACCGKVMPGNDGELYVSKRASDGSCRWHPMITRSQSKVKKGCA